MKPNETRGVLSASTLKLLACLLMLVDHIGLTFFPSVALFRIIGRLAFPLFAFFIAEGCKYTRNRLKRFLLVFVLGVICESVYVLYAGELEGNILLTFSLSILLIYALGALKHAVFLKRPPVIVGTSLLLLALLVAAYPLSVFFDLDYGYAGVLLPLFVSLFDYKEGYDPPAFRSLDRLWVKLIAFFVGLLLLVASKGFSSLQVWCLPSIVLLMLYNGKVGSRHMKYGFYLFYPLHLLALELIAVLMK